MNTPKLLAGATEGGAEVFKLDYFGKEATLAQSAQFYKQMMVGVFERVFESENRFVLYDRTIDYARGFYRLELELFVRITIVDVRHILPKYADA